MDRDKFDIAASSIVEEHIRVHDSVMPHPDWLKDAIARELRNTWNEAINAAENVVRSVRRVVR